MKTRSWLLAVAALALTAQIALAQAPAGSPAGATGQCKDGTYSNATSKAGACRGHKGVQSWFAASAASPAAPTSTGAPITKSRAAKSASTSSAAQPASTSAAAQPASTSPATQPARPATASRPMSPASAGPSAPVTSPVYRQAPASPAAAAPASQPAPPASQSASSAARRGPAANAAARPETPGGGPGTVWVNTETKVYHCPGTSFYGKTKQGKYMSEADAKSAGARADHNRPCGN